MTQRDLWNCDDLELWQSTLDSYPEVIERQGVKGLADRDMWYRHNFTSKLHNRARPYVTLDELVQVTEWKMARGVWRARNLALVRGNAPDLVTATSEAALATLDGTVRAVSMLSKLAGIGPATASAITAAAAPEQYAFFDELVAAQIPRSADLAFNLKYYTGYLEQIQKRAESLGHGWSPAKVEQALWANAGGKAGGKTELA